jgi:hypothetical protein
MFGVGAPAARQVIVASFPSSTVAFCGGISITGTAAVKIGYSPLTLIDWKEDILYLPALRDYQTFFKSGAH